MLKIIFAIILALVSQLAPFGAQSDEWDNREVCKGVVYNFSYVWSEDVYKTVVNLDNGEQIEIFDYLAPRNAVVLVEIDRGATNASYDDTVISVISYSE